MTTLAERETLLKKKTPRRKKASEASVASKVANHAAKQRYHVRSQRNQGFTFSSLVRKPISAQETIDVIRKTLPATIVSDAMTFLSAPQAEILAALRIPTSSFHRKIAFSKPLSPEETERVMRLADITRIAADAFGGPVEARAWMTSKNIALGGQSPFSLLDTDAGANQVRRVLSVVNYGGSL